MIDTAVSDKFCNLSFVAACLVVYIHLGVVVATHGTAWWFKQLMTEGICRMAVPFFFLASGFFLAQHVNETGWWRREIGKRVRSILLPYLIWCAFYVVFSVVLQLVANIAAHRAIWNNAFRVDEAWTWFGLDLTQAPSMTPLWFLRTLFFFVLFSPVINMVDADFACGCFFRGDVHD